MDATEYLLSRDPFVVRRRVAWGECDPAKVVFTPRFADYAVSARDWFLRESVGLLDRPGTGASGLTYPMRAMAFDFRSFLAADDLFDMGVKVAAVSERTFTLQVDATHAEGRACFGVTMTCVCVDPAVGRPASLPAELGAALSAWVKP